jgi:16S rRNA (uracil1498-N3)-methyltransferase
VELPEAASHHAQKVLRLAPGAAIELFDGAGNAWRAELARGGKLLRAVLGQACVADLEPPLAVTLVQGLPAADKMDWIVQKCVELGVAAFRPVAARRSVVRLSGERMERRVTHWQNVAVAACEQCGRNRLPPVAPLVDLPRYLGETPAAGETRLLLAPDATQRLRDLPPPAGPVTLLIGPEGGFEPEEIRAAQIAGFVPVALGPRVLRTETAGAAALAAMMVLWGDM